MNGIAVLILIGSFAVTVALLVDELDRLRVERQHRAAQRRRFDRLAQDHRRARWAETLHIIDPELGVDPDDVA